MANLSYKLTFLGTSAGTPTNHRNVSALAVHCQTSPTEPSAPWILIDCGEGTVHQLMRAKISPSTLMAICITHVHGDHCYGLAGLLANLSMQGRTHTLTIIAPSAIGDLIHTLVAFTDLRLSYPIDFIAIEQTNRSVVLELGKHHSLHIDITPLSHRCDCYAFGLTQHVERRRLNIDALTELGIDKRHWNQILHHAQPTIDIDGSNLKIAQALNISRHQQKIVIAGDNDTPDLLHQAVQGASLLVHEATYTQAVLEKVLTRIDPMHSSAKQVAQFANDVKLPNLILTHFSARFAPYDAPDSDKPNMGHIHQEVRQYYHGNWLCAKDFMQVTVDESGRMNVLNTDQTV